MLRRETASFLPTASTASFPLERFVPPSTNKQKNYCFSNPLNRKNSKNFFLCSLPLERSHPFWTKISDFSPFSGLKIQRWDRSFIAPCVFTPFTGNVLPPSIHKRKEHIFRTLKIRKNSENFPSTSFGDIGSVLNERKLKIQRKSPEIKSMPLSA